MFRHPRSLALAVGVLLGACNKAGSSGTTSPAVQPDADPLDKAATTLVERLQAADFEGLRSQTADPLTHDLSRAEFDDLSNIVKWLGTLQGRTETNTDMNYGGGQRWYELQFEKGDPVELEVSLDEAGKLIGFQFSGDGYTQAERGVLAEPWREFKVYDFTLLSGDGAALPAGTAVTGNRVEYELVVGGIEAFVGEHHLTIQKILLDASGKEMFREPVEFDTKFGEDATGIPRGVVRGHVEVPGPGTWELDLQITDQNSNRTIESRHKFDTTAG